jgi:adenylosuccinate lyase
MIERYTTPEMKQIWSDRNRFAIWLEVETTALEVMADQGLAPRESALAVRERGGFDCARIQEIEAEVDHDVIAFLTCVAEYVGPEAGHLHRGMTSSDLLDTSLALQLRAASEAVLDALEELRTATGRLAERCRDLPAIGRSHGVHAEPITLGLKFASWYAELGRGIERLRRETEGICTGKISGAVGTFAHLPPTVEAEVCRRLGLSPDPVSTQIVARDRHAGYLGALAILGSSMDRFATEIRHLARTEVGEVEEPFGKKQKGSSAMPHKRNPITCERVSGMARLLRGNLLAALENIPLWHERDISHSSVERVILPDSTNLVHYMAIRLRRVIDGLRIFPDNVRRNLDLSSGLIASQAFLLALVDRGLTREDAYRLVQGVAMRAREAGRPFRDEALSSSEMRDHLSAAEMEELGSLDRHFRHVDTIFKRVGLNVGEGS